MLSNQWAVAALRDMVNVALESFVIDASIPEVICRDLHKGFYHLANAIVLCCFPPQNYWNCSLCELGASWIWYWTKCFRIDLCPDFDLVSVAFMAQTSFALRNTVEQSYCDISGCFPSWRKEQRKCPRELIYKQLCKDWDLQFSV